MSLLASNGFENEGADLKDKAPLKVSILKKSLSLPPSILKSVVTDPIAEDLVLVLILFKVL